MLNIARNKFETSDEETRRKSVECSISIDRKHQKDKKIAKEKLSDLAKWKKLKTKKNNSLLIAFETNSLYPSVTADCESIYREIYIRYVFTKGYEWWFGKLIREPEFYKKQRHSQNKNTTREKP